ncbi:MAG: hypothetical protein ACXWUG_14885 [Polyangiales bacterium]
MRALALGLLLVGCGGSVASTPVAEDSGAVDASPTDTSAVVDSAATEVAIEEATVDSGASDLVVSSVALGMYEGKLARFVVTSRVDGSLVAKGQGRIDKGAVSVRIANAMSHDVFGVQLDVYVDLAEDDACNGMDPAWDQLVTNDFSKAEIDYSFDPKGAGVTAITCDKIGK